MSVLRNSIIDAYLTKTVDKNSGIITYNFPEEARTDVVPETVQQSTDTEPKSESSKSTSFKQHNGRLLHKGIILTIIVCLVWLFIPIRFFEIV